MRRSAHRVKGAGNPSGSSIEPVMCGHDASPKEHRLVYRIVGADLVILQARFHYQD